MGSTPVQRFVCFVYNMDPPTYIYIHMQTHIYISTHLGTGEGVAQHRGQGAGARGVAEDGVPWLDGGEPRCWILVSAFFSGGGWVRCVFWGRNVWTQRTNKRVLFGSSSPFSPLSHPWQRRWGCASGRGAAGWRCPLCVGGGVVLDFVFGCEHDSYAFGIRYASDETHIHT